jgi:hypothetical protein
MTMDIDEMIERIEPRRKPAGIAARCCPSTFEGRIGHEGALN